MDHGLREERRRGGAVACDVIRLRRDFFHELSAHVFKGIFQFDLTGNGYAVVDDVRSAEFLVQNNIAAFRAEGNLDSVRQLIYAAEQCRAGFFIVQYFLSHLCHSCQSKIRKRRGYPVR